MGLEEEIKKEEEELKKLEEADEAEAKKADEEEDDNSEDENEEEEASDDEDEEEGDDDDEEEEASDDEDEEEGDDEDEGKKKKTDDISNQDAAKARIERRKRLKAEEELARLREREQERHPRQQETKDDKTETRKETADERLDRIEREQETTRLRAQAADELSALENEFMADNPDYKDASTHMIKSMYQGARHFYPNITEKQAVELVQNKVLEIASAAAKRGQNPVEVLYQMAFDNYGFDGTQKAETPGKKKTNAAENLKKKAKNRKRSANGLSGGGQNAGARVTIEEADKMSLADFGNMSEAEIDELIAQAGE